MGQAKFCFPIQNENKNTITTKEQKLNKRKAFSSKMYLFVKKCNILINYTFILKFNLLTIFNVDMFYLL